MTSNDVNLEKLGSLFDSKIIAILKEFFAKPDHEFYLRELSRESKVSLATTSRIISKLENMELINVYKLSKFKAYMLADNSFVEFLSGIISVKRDPLQVFIDKVADIREVSSIILHGRKTQTEANIILIGTYFDQSYLREIIQYISNEFEFNISYLTLSEDQFETMTKMGLYHENRTVIYTKK